MAKQCKLFSILQNNTDTAMFHLIKKMHNLPPHYCNVHICVRQEYYIGCKKSLDCVLTIPITSLSRDPRSYEEPSEELLQECEQENSEYDSIIHSCSDKMWDVFYATGYAEGEVSLRINLQGNDKVFFNM